MAKNFLTDYFDSRLNHGFDVLQEFCSIDIENAAGCDKMESGRDSVGILRDKQINSIKELRESLDAKEILEAFMDNTLYEWLSDNYYESEADAIAKLSIDTPNCLKRICSILGINYIDTNTMSEEDKKAFEEKKAKVAEFTQDPEILSEVWLVAMNQRELSQLIRKGEKKIYLCGEDFSVPIKIPNMSYIGIGNAGIEGAYTKEQYERAGISIKGISLPTDINPEKEHLAKEAALKNGYDDFAEKHTSLATLFHNRLKTSNLYFHCRLPLNTSVMTNSYTSKTECEKVRYNAIRKAYDEAGKYVTPGNSKSISKEAAVRYNEIITKCFSDSVMDSIQTLSKMGGTNDAFDKLKKLISDGYKSLLTSFEAELNDSSDYYQLYDFNYFLEQAEIEEHDYRINEEGFFKIVETIFANNIEYSVTDIFTPIHEMERDINTNAGTFFNTASSVYAEYCSKIIEQLDRIAKTLPKMENDEDLDKYTVRVCVEKAL